MKQRTTYNNGLWTTARFNSFITSILRSGSRRWGPKYSTLNEAKTEKKINPASGRLAQHFLCASCLQLGLFTWIDTFAPRAQEGQIAGCLHSSGYIFIRVDNKTHKAHRLAFLFMYGYLPDKMVDHIDGNKSNNRFTNLRLVSASINQQNRKKVLGATKWGSRWRAQIMLDRRKKHIMLIWKRNEKSIKEIPFDN